MGCVNPLVAFKTASGDILFVERGDVVAQLSLPCGQCIECRLRRSREWAMRCMHEASLYRDNCFLTLTFNDQHLPYRGMLDYEVFQKFMKRYRFHVKHYVRFYMCGEYGELNWRPHFHACIFGHDFPDKVFFKTTESGEKIYTSEFLSKLWPFGHASIGALTFESAGYVARYCVQKVTGDAAKVHYRREDADGVYHLPPEFNRMSLKPGIGARWLDIYTPDVYPHDYVVVDGRKLPTPKYYDKRFKKAQPEVFEDLQFRREVEGRSRYADNTPERLAVKAEVTKARLRYLKRSNVDGSA